MLENGDGLALTEKRLRMLGHSPLGDVYIDGSGVGDIGKLVIADRRMLSEEGLVVVVLTMYS